MKSIFAIVVSWSFIVPLFAFSQDTNVYRVTSQNCLNLRSGPNNSAPLQGCLPSGTVVNVINSIPYWRQIHANGYPDGWVAKKYLEPVSAPLVGGALTTASIPADAWLEVHFVDVGQGDAIWIHTHDDNHDGNGEFEGYNI